MQETAFTVCECEPPSWSRMIAPGFNARLNRLHNVQDDALGERQSPRSEAVEMLHIPAL